MQWESLLPPLTLSDFDKIWTVASLHHVLSPSKISWHSDILKMPKLSLKVKNWQIKFVKNQLICGDNAKLCRGGVIHDSEIFIGVVDDLQKKFQPLFSIFCLPKKINWNRYHVQNVKKSKILASGGWHLSPKPPVLQSSHVF